MTAVEAWCLVAVVAAGVGGLLRLLGGPRPIPLVAVGSALGCWAIAALAVAVAVSLL